MKIAAFVFLLLLAPQLSAMAAAQDALEEAKAQYEAAAYEEALAALTKLEDVEPDDRVFVEQYRALCLIALGKIPEAERAVAALVVADPTYVPSSSVASPKVLTLIAEIRKKELPAVARRLLDSGRDAYKANDLPAAQQQFTLLSRLLDDPAMSERPDREDLRALAEGFLALTAATPPAPSTAKATPARLPSAVSGTTGSAATANDATAKVPTASPAPTEQSSRPHPEEAPSAARDIFVPAVAIEQQLPEWVPPSASVARFQYNGKLRVRINAEGKVVSATIDQVSHPAYDARLLQVAPTWRYKPATRDGVPTESERVIAIRLSAGS